MLNELNIKNYFYYNRLIKIKLKIYSLIGLYFLIKYLIKNNINMQIFVYLNVPNVVVLGSFREN